MCRVICLYDLAHSLICKIFVTVPAQAFLAVKAVNLFEFHSLEYREFTIFKIRILCLKIQVGLYFDETESLKPYSKLLLLVSQSQQVRALYPL